MLRPEQVGIYSHMVLLNLFLHIRITSREDKARYDFQVQPMSDLDIKDKGDFSFIFVYSATF